MAFRKLRCHAILVDHPTRQAQLKFSRAAALSEHHGGCSLLTGYDFGIEVHYENLPEQNESIQKYIEDYHKPVYAIPNDGAVILDANKIVMIGEVQYFAV